MSKLIRKLANEARIDVGQRIGYTDRDREEAFEGVFAELIVKECALQCNHNDDMDRILDHFGVE